MWGCRIPFIRWRYGKVAFIHLLVFALLTRIQNRNDKYLYMGGPLLAGITVVALSSLAPMVLPMGMRSLAIAEAISLYGGLAVFSGFVLYEYVVIPLTTFQ